MGDKLKGLAKKPIFWIAIVGVALFAIIRGRASSTRQFPEAGPRSPFSSGGGGGQVSGGAGIQDQLTQQDLAASQGQEKRLQALFDFQIGEKKAQDVILAPLQQAWANANAGQYNLISAGYQNLLDIAKTGKLRSGKGIIPTSCQHGDVVIDTYTGLPTCRSAEGGGFRPFQQLGGMVQGSLQGFENVMSGIWQGAAAAAPNLTQAYLGRVTGLPTGAGGGNQRTGDKAPRSNRQQQGMSNSVTGINGGQFQIPTFPGLP